MAWSSPRDWFTGETVTAAHMNQEVRDNLDALAPHDVTLQAWSPTMDGSVSGNLVVQSAGQHRIGAVMHVWALFRLDVAGPPSGTFSVTLPTAASGIADGTVVGTGHAFDTSTPANREPLAVALSNSGADVVFLPSGASIVNDTTPFTWGNDDELRFSAFYPVA